MATGWQSSDLLARFNRFVGRPATDSMQDTTKYGFLADAQAAIINRIAGIDAKTLFGAPQQLLSADGGYTYTFGTDGGGYPLFPVGPAKIYNSLAAIPFYPLQPGLDYLDEGTTIRGPNNTPIPGPLYWYGLTFPALMSATVQPILEPPSMRICIAYKAASDFAEAYGGLNVNTATIYAAKYEQEFGQNMTLVRRHFRGGGCCGRLLLPYGVPAGLLSTSSPI